MQKIDIKLRPSKILIVLAIGIIIACMAILSHLHFSSQWVRPIIAALIMPYAWGILRDYAILTSPHAIYGLYKADDGWSIQNRLRSTPAELCGSSTVTGLICILRFKVQGERRKRSCIIFRDSLNQDDYRKLLVELRTNAAVIATDP